MRILGISRSPQYSPHSVDRDAAIFAAVGSRMLRGSNYVAVISEDLYITVDLSEFDLVFSMARDPRVVQSLAEAERDQGLLVFNSASALLKANRASLTEAFEQAGVAQPASRVINLNEPDGATSIKELHFPLWLKRGDACAQTAADVCFLSSPDELPQALEALRNHGAVSVVASEHAEGDLVKFYGVAGTDFFSWSYPAEGSFSKFGLEAHNGQPHHYAFDEAALQELATRAAQASGLTIYGGDAIVCADGTLLLIDFNDWPSFAPCRKEAARAIGQRLKAALAQSVTHHHTTDTHTTHK